MQGKQISRFKVFIDEAVTNYPLLSREEEYTLATAYYNGDVKARDKIIVANLRFLIKDTKRYVPSNKLEDMIQEGLLGLIESLETFDPERGTRFLTYGLWRARARIIKQLKKRNGYGGEVQHRMLERELQKMLEENPDLTPEEMAANLKRNISTQHIQDVLTIYSTQKPISLDYSFEEQQPLLEKLEAKTTPLDEAVYNEQLQDAVTEVLEELEPIERRILMSRMYHGKKIKELSDELGLSPIQISDRYCKVKRKFQRIALEKPIIREYVEK